MRKMVFLENVKPCKKEIQARKHLRMMILLKIKGKITFPKITAKAPVKLKNNPEFFFGLNEK